MERKKLFKKNFVVTEQGLYVYNGGVRSKVPIGWYHSSRGNLLVSEFASWGRVLGWIVGHLIT